MQPVKDTKRAIVRIGYDGRVHKTFRGPMAQERFENEVKMLKYLEAKGCAFVPRVVEADPEKLYLVTTNCGARVQHISPERIRELYAELETYGVKHEDPFDRNITYRSGDGRFCVIDFEFATLVESGEGLKQPVDGPVVGHLGQ
jgi:tRNA A-37 threonylcarbamoyl transferase component Bud32